MSTAKEKLKAIDASTAHRIPITEKIM